MALSTDDLVAVRGVMNDFYEALLLPRFDQIDERFDQIDDRFNRGEREFNSFRNEVRADLALINRRLSSVEVGMKCIEGKVEALEADIKEIYQMMEQLKNGNSPNKKFLKLQIKEKILVTNNLLVITAKEAGVTLPR